jgi:hypothetical protein
MVARGLGRSTAQDLIRFFGGGFAEESLRIIQRQQQGGAVSNVTNDNRTVDSSSTIDQRTIIEGNVYGGDAGLRHLKRKLDEAGRKDLGRVQR